MKKEELIRKLTSRKFIIAIITAIVGVITLAAGYNETVQTIAGAAMVIVPAVVYCFIEGKVDAASVKTVTDATAEAAKKLGADNNTTEQIEKIGGAIEAMVDENSTGGAEAKKTE